VSDASYVLDASALLCLLHSEPGASRVASALEDGVCVISAVNFAEVIAKLDEVGVPPADLLDLAAGLNVQVVPFDEGQAMGCAMLRKKTRSLGLSLGDRACLNLAEQHGAVALTADRTWSRVKAPASVEVLR
jgi:PIN domain nuclease of toxin-antitoxin system